MKVRHSLICFFLLSLINAVIPVHEGTEGGIITVACDFKLSGKKKLFCKEKCEEGNVLIETTDVRAQSGRYSLEYEEGFYPKSSTILYVSISQLTKSDSGRYRCGLDRTWLPDGFSEFEIRVSDEQSDQQQTDRPTAPPSPPPAPAAPAPPAPPARSGVLLYVRVVLTIMVVLVSLGLLIFCMRRTNNNKDASADTELTPVTEANRVYEEIREDRRSRSPPEASSANVYANFTKPTETTSDHCSQFSARSKKQLWQHFIFGHKKQKL
ncbi:uncharacterized protein [Thunnus thynnus]|uniref:uncharacterized protein n=1 Tax=Thunnus thynnus TaxID=8237 RepID=UPI0035283909